MNTSNLYSVFTCHDGKASDKWSSYFPDYDRVFAPFRDLPVNLLEIGVQNGGSLEIWAKYFPQAQAIIGCDVNPLCNQLVFDDERISVIVGDATREDTARQIRERCAEFDLIIDDGSHKSSDIVQAFLAYFPLLRDGGIFVVEDLVCSYWREYQGGLYAAASSISFFKLLVDYLNRDAWGVPVDASAFFGCQGFDVTDHVAVLDAVQRVEFSPSICVIQKAQGLNRGLGPRVVAGRDFPVQDAIRELAGKPIQVPPQTGNRESFLPGGSE